MTSFLDHLDLVCNALNRCDIPFVIGGSVASSLWGRARQTNDADFAVRAKAESGKCLGEALGPDYVIFPRDWAELVLESNYPCAEISHVSGDFRADLFLVATEAFTESEFVRAVLLDLGSGSPKPIASAEDIVIQKLRWYELGNRVSDRQWNDIVQVLEIQAGRLDSQYMATWAKHFDVTELLDQALSEAYRVGSED